jgi:hypothetical protein
MCLLKWQRCWSAKKIIWLTPYGGGVSFRESIKAHPVRNAKAMTRDEWAQFEKIENDPDVQLAMRARCEEQGHDWENAADFLPLRGDLICKWCKALS